MRRGLIAVVLLAALAAMASAGLAQERPLAALVPADVSVYSEMNLDRMLTKTSDMADLREVFANMQALKVAAKVVAADPEAKRVYDQVMQVAGDLSAALGPSIGWGFWTPDLAGLVGVAMSGGTEGGGMPGMPQLLLVAQVRDSEKLERSLSFIIEKAQVPAEESEERNGVKVTPIAQGQVALARGQGWLALSWPADLADKVEAQAAGPAGGSLADDPAYQRAMARLPKEAMIVRYISPQAIKQLLATTTLVASSASFPPPGEDGIAAAMGVRVEEVEGRKMLTVYHTTDLSALQYLVDVPLSLGAGMLGPVLAKSRQEAPKTQCLSNVKNIALAMQMFSMDNNRFPSADKWVDELKPYLANDAVLKCPEDKSSARCSYGMNKALSKKAVKKIKNPYAVVAIYETAHPGRNPSGGKKDVVSPPRHQGGNNFGYADGHAEWKSADEEVKF